MSNRKISRWLRKNRGFCLTAILTIVICLFCRYMGFWQSEELRFFDQFTQRVAPKSFQERVVIVKITEEDVKRFPAFIPDDHLSKFISSINHHRDITFKKISLDEEAKKESLSQDEIMNYYNQEGSQFMLASKSSFSIIDLNTNFLESKVLVTDSEVSAELINLEEQSSNSGQKRISHIQVDFDSLSKIEALKEVNEIKNQIDSGLISFKDAVTNFSDDLGSKSLEGDLGYTDGTIFPIEFEEVIKDLSLNEISSVVELSSSLHLIKLTESNVDTYTARDARNSLIDQKTQSLFVSIEENILSSIDGNKNLIEISQSVDLPIKSFSNVSLLVFV